MASGHLEEVRFEHSADSIFQELLAVLREFQCEVKRQDDQARALIAEHTSKRRWGWGLLALPAGLITQPLSLTIAARVDAVGDHQSLLTIEARQLYGQPYMVADYRKPALAIVTALAERLKSTTPAVSRTPRG